MSIDIMRNSCLRLRLWFIVSKTGLQIMYVILQKFGEKILKSMSWPF